jgi:hypothetical protein
LKKKEEFHPLWPIVESHATNRERKNRTYNIQAKRRGKKKVERKKE